MNNKQDIRDRVKTYEDACRVLGIDNKTPELPNIPERDRRGVTAYYKLIIITRALNEGWEPDWKDGEQKKMVPYFYFDRENNTTAGFAYASTDLRAFEYGCDHRLPALLQNASAREIRGHAV